MTTLLRSFVVLFALSLGLGAAGCGSSTEDICTSRCEKSVTCGTADDQATCLSICLKQAEDEAYAEAIDDQADCYEESTCTDIENGFCNPQDL
jgi:hypothetical protein